MSRPDDDGSRTLARAEARERQRERAGAERAERAERPEWVRREAPDLLGLRLGDREVSAARSLGISLIDRELVEHVAQLERDIERLAEQNELRMSLRERFSPDRAERPSRPLGFFTCTAGPALGPAPSVSLDGKQDWSVPLNWSLPRYSPFPTWTPEFQAGRSTGPGGGPETVMSADYGVNGPIGSGRVSVGSSFVLERDGASRVYFQGRVLGLTCQIGLETGAVIEAMERKFNAAARRLAPYAKDALDPLNLPLAP